MTTSDRSSPRVAEASGDRLVRAPVSANSGADGRDILLAYPYGSRVSRRQLARMRAGLSDRDIAVLRALEQFHFLTTTQVEHLLFPVGTMTPLAAARSCRRVLARLHTLRLVDRLERRVGGVRAGSASQVHTVSPLGARLLKTPTRRRSREPSLAHLNHVLAVAGLVVRLHERARAEGLELLIVETEPDCWRPIVAPHGGRQLLKPDLRLAVGVGDQELHWFVEQDNATEHRPVLERKCHAYFQAWHDGRIRAELGIFPRVLWVVPDERRAAFVELVITELAGFPSGMFVISTSDAAADTLVGAGGRP